jgi:hypothetical protein
MMRSARACVICLWATSCSSRGLSAATILASNCSLVIPLSRARSETFCPAFRSARSCSGLIASTSASDSTTATTTARRSACDSALVGLVDVVGLGLGLAACARPPATPRLRMVAAAPPPTTLTAMAANGFRTAKPGHHGGGRYGKNCLACKLPDDQQAQLNEALVGRVPLLRLEKRWGISRTALRAHRATHITPALVALRTERIAGGVRKVADRVEDLIVLTDAILVASRANGNAYMGLKGVREQRANFELLARVTGELDERAQVVVNLQQTTEWLQVQTVVLKFVHERLGPKDREELSRRLRLLDGADVIATARGAVPPQRSPA